MGQPMLTITCMERRKVMKQVFIDTYNFVAGFKANDELHAWVVEVEQDLGAAKLVTSEMVLAEALNYFSAFRYEVKQGRGRVRVGSAAG